MPEETQHQFDFLNAFVISILEENGLEDLTPEQKNIYIPLIVGQVQERLGIELLPKLSEEHLEEFNKLIQKEDISDDEWKIFWNEALPTLEEDIKEILKKFANEARSILAV